MFLNKKTMNFSLSEKIMAIHKREKMYKGGVRL